MLLAADPVGWGKPEYVRFEARAMGSALSLILADGSSARHDWASVIAEFEAAEAAMSRFRETSEVTRLNQTAGSGRAICVSMRLRRALVLADRATRMTDGRFDPRVLPDLDRLGYRGAAVPPGAAPTGSGPVVRRHGRAGLDIERAVDLGGIGKGLTLRWAADILERAGRRDYLLDAGGDIVARGMSPDDGPWRVGIEDPTGDSESTAVIEVSDLAVATSSTRVNRWTVDGRTVHHLLDPRTREPADRGLVAVTVAGPDPAWAEVWSKDLFLSGAASIATRARSRGLAAWWVADDGALEMTAAARALTIWVRAEEVDRAV